MAAEIKKILMLNNEYPPLGGGTGTVNKEILERLSRFPELKIDLITGWQRETKEIEWLNDNVRIIKLGTNNKNIHHASNLELIKYAIKAFFESRKLHKVEKYDLSFGWSTIPAGFVSYLLSILYKIPYIIRIGGPDIPGYDSRYSLIYKLITPIIKVIWRNSTVLISKCLRERNMIREIMSKLSINLISNGIDLRKFKPSKFKDRKILTMICPARLTLIKSQDTILRALAELNKKGIEVYLNLVGDGDETNNYQNLVKRLKIEKLVKFKGYISRDKIVNEYHSADIFILSSKKEGMSNALLEGMACGLPILITDVGGTEELVVHGENGYIYKVGDYLQLSSYLEQLYYNRELVKKMGRDSAEKVGSLSWDNIVLDYRALIINAIK